jgi:hypothetical protein
MAGGSGGLLTSRSERADPSINLGSEIAPERDWLELDSVRQDRRLASFIGVSRPNEFLTF